jgi:predicted anti-sigma-YlaC factor YlaD
MKTLERLWSRLTGMATCREVGKMMQTYLDGELDGANADNVTAHLELCLRCGMEADTYGRIKQALAHVSADGMVHPEDQLAIERLRRFADALTAAHPGGT